ncbi:hypothetical protein [Streptomyces sp. ISL-96]|uniref:hypothetical protein n=1 Tax=Streptomyces sp. ISL-96 TaxID=2819191 RepID=UPI0035AC0780
MITVTPADIQDRDAVRDVFWRLRLTQPQITQVWADRGYAGELVDWARERLWLTLRIVSSSRAPRASSSCPAAGHDRLVYERPPQRTRLRTSAPALRSPLNWALITMMTRRLTRKSPRTSHWTKKTP